jgi:hypothetical protein
VDKVFITEVDRPPALHADVAAPSVVSQKLPTQVPDEYTPPTCPTADADVEYVRSTL